MDAPLQIDGVSQSIRARFDVHRAAAEPRHMIHRCLNGLLVIADDVRVLRADSDRRIICVECCTTYVFSAIQLGQGNHLPSRFSTFFVMRTTCASFP